jgi:hypothetical protein
LKHALQLTAGVGGNAARTAVEFIAVGVRRAFKADSSQPIQSIFNRAMSAGQVFV